MRNQGQIFVGVGIIVIALAMLLAGAFDVDPGMVCWPTFLILLGIWILIRPHMIGRDTALRLSLFGPIRREGAWQVQHQEIWLGIGDVRLDFTETAIPEGETVIRLFAFIGNVRLRVPEDVGIMLSSTALISSLKALGKKQDSFVIPAHLSSEGYEAAQRRIRLEATCFIADVTAK